jgi:hypothetical protein
MHVTAYIPNVRIYTGLRPKISAASPTKAGAIVATAMYVVTVRLIFEIGWPKALERKGMAG